MEYDPRLDAPSSPEIGWDDDTDEDYDWDEYRDERPCDYEMGEGDFRLGNAHMFGVPFSNYDRSVTKA
jgi:hypothetical protein